MKEQKNPFVQLAAAICGIFVAITALILIFADAGILVPIAWAFVILGIVLGAFIYKSQSPKKK